MRKLIFIILLVSFSAIYYSTTSSDEKSVVHQAILDIKKMVNNSSIFNKKTSDEINNSLKTDLDKSLTDPTQSLQDLSPEEFKSWMTKESNLMNSAYNNTEEKQIQLKAQAQSLKAPQIATLKEIAGNSDLPINDRILSVYMISLNSTEPSLQALYDGALLAIPELPPYGPHSESEIKGTQELVLRYMQIDELFQRAKTDSNAFDKLKLLVNTSSSEQVRSYAQKKIKELN